MLEQGASKTDVQAETGQVVGLNRVSLSVEQGEIFVVMGLSGSGKSTLIRHVNRLIEPTAGEMRVNGRDILGLDEMALRQFRRKELAMVFQNFGLLPHRSVLDNVAYGLEIRGDGKDERLEHARHWIERVGLAGYEGSQPNELSGGQQQRVGLARALAMDTDILLMDEAFSALDPLIRSGMQDELKSLQKELNKTILFISHDFDEAVKIGDRIAVLNDGAIVQVDRPEDIVLKPADDYVAAFVRDVNKARVIHISTIMERDLESPCGFDITATASCEDALPLFAAHDALAVTNEDGKRVGRITARRVIAALARHAG
ncbi:MAG: betaine/proline/choline family ABC transporter ATP-binding protein [Hyphomicrobiaceae bacterium]|nr:betaine/proline/choline family ABC transporter ATP-binding protein [Hyphomicrobiaceae bacterium]